MRYFNALGLALTIGLAAVTVHASSTRAAEALSADTPLATVGGATFTAPTGWSVTAAANKTVLDPPEADSHLALFDVQASDADAAVAAGWAIYRPDAHRPLRLATPQAPRNGWEERHVYGYETSPNEKAVIYALAWRAGQDWTVVLVEASLSTFERRNAAFSLTIGSLRPKGYQREMFAERKAHPLDAERIALLKGLYKMSYRRSTFPGSASASSTAARLYSRVGWG